MATATVLKFMQTTADDSALRQQLESLLGVGDGNISSEAELDAEESEALTGRAPVVAEFASQNGFEFSVDDLITVVDAFQQHQAGTLSDTDLAAIVGFSDLAIDVTDHATKLTNPLKSLTHYLSKTYLGINLSKA